MNSNLLFGLAWVLMPSFASSQATSPVDGQSLFEASCLPCHDSQGTGTTMLGHRLGNENALLTRRDDLTTSYIIAVLRNGVGSMPPYRRSEITDDEAEAIATYLSTEPDHPRRR